MAALRWMFFDLACTFATLVFDGPILLLRSCLRAKALNASDDLFRRLFLFEGWF